MIHKKENLKLLLKSRANEKGIEPRAEQYLKKSLFPASVTQWPATPAQKDVQRKEMLKRKWSSKMLRDDSRLYL